MLTTVELNNQSMLEAGEIDDITADGCLSAKFAAADLPVADTVPKVLLDFGLRDTKIAGAS